MSLGFPKEKKTFPIGLKNSEIDLTIFDEYRQSESRTLRWAIEDLLNEYPAEDTYNQPANSNAENQARMDWLIDNNEWDLPTTYDLYVTRMVTIILLFTAG